MIQFVCFRTLLLCFLKPYELKSILLSISQKKMFNKLKHDLESWREVILHTNSLLKWDKKFYPGIIFAVISIFYLLLWYLDLSTLTLISLSLLVVTIIDYVFPLVSRIVFKTENWTGTQENKFEEICQELCATKIKLCSFYNYIFTAKEEKSTMVSIGLHARRHVFCLHVPHHVRSRNLELIVTFICSSSSVCH